MEGWKLEIPKWEGQMIFSKDIVLLFMLIGLIISGILLCFLGYQYFQTIVLILVGFICGVLGTNIAERLFVESIYKMIFFVMFTFFGVLGLFVITSLISKLLIVLHLYNKLVRKIYIIAPIFGSTIVALLIYFFIYQNLLITIGICFMLFLIGFIYSKKRMKTRKPFYSYDDLCQLKPLKEVKKNA